MMFRPQFSWLIALAFVTAACGTSGDGAQTRPIEILYYVSGGPNLQFEFASTPDPACGSPGTGIQAVNANHQFGDRVFQTPHLFVLENNRQPVRAVIRNLSAEPIQVNMFLGTVAVVQGSQGLIAPGACATIQSGDTTGLIPAPRGPEVRTEICSPTDGLRTPCLESTADRSIAFFATTGDIVASNLTNCILLPFLDACRSPATFFFETPQDQFDAVMSVNPGQSPEGQPKAELRAELYINGNLTDTDTGTEPIVGKNF